MFGHPTGALQSQITGQNSHSAPFSQPKPGNDTPTFDQLSPTKVGLLTTKLTVLALPWSPLNYSALLILRLSALPKSFWRALTHISKLRMWAEPNGQSDCFLVKQTGRASTGLPPRCSSNFTVTSTDSSARPSPPGRLCATVQLHFIDST